MDHPQEDTVCYKTLCFNEDLISKSKYSMMDGGSTIYWSKGKTPLRLPMGLPFTPATLKKAALKNKYVQGVHFGFTDKDFKIMWLNAHPEEHLKLNPPNSSQPPKNSQPKTDMKIFIVAAAENAKNFHRQFAQDVVNDIVEGTIDTKSTYQPFNEIATQKVLVDQVIDEEVAQLAFDAFQEIIILENDELNKMQDINDALMTCEENEEEVVVNEAIFCSHVFEDGGECFRQGLYAPEGKEHITLCRQHSAKKFGHTKNTKVVKLRQGKAGPPTKYGYKMSRKETNQRYQQKRKQNLPNLMRMRQNLQA